MNKLLVMINSESDLELVKKKNIDGIILSIKDLSVNASYYISPSELNEIIKNFSEKEIFVSINKIMHNSDLLLLEDTLKYLDNKNIKVLFYDLGVISIVIRLNLNIDLVVYQDHLNASIYSNNFFKSEGINYSVITSDITLEEILDIKKETNIKILKVVYGYLPIFYSRRYLISNYLNYIEKEKKDHFYYINNNNDTYPIDEEKYGTTIYSKEKIDLINEIDNFKNIDYLIINGYMEDDLSLIIDKYIEGKKDDSEKYVGFLHEKTIFKVKE